MTSPEFSVLLLAWDDADPRVTVLGGAALPPTLPLVYQLAARQPVVAVYPHLPVSAAPTSNAQQAPKPDVPAEPKNGATTLETDASEAAKGAINTAVFGVDVLGADAFDADAFDTTVALPGVLLLPPLVATEAAVVAAAPTRPSRIIGLANLAPTAASPSVPASTEPASGKKPSNKSTAAPRNQWPTGADAPAASRASWQAPAAPYLGAEVVRIFPPPPPPAPPRFAAAEPADPATGPAPTTRQAEPNGPAAGPAVRPRSQPQAGDLNFDPDPELPAVRRPAVFDELTAAVGPAEAFDLSAPEDDIVPDAPGPTTAAAAAVSPAASEPAPAAAVTPLVRMPAPEGLNFRMIQYARQAAQLVRGRADFGAIYAPSWPAWLAALEIRNSSGRPLVLYATGLTADRPNPTERGWQLELERMALRRARLILVPDEAVGRHLRARYGGTIGEVRVVPAADEQGISRALREAAAG